MAALKYWLWLTTAPGLSNRVRLLLLEHFSSPEDVYYAQPDELCLVEGITKQQVESLSDKSLTRAERVLADCAKDGQFIVTMEDAAYPARLRDMYDPPVLLYGKGSMPLFDEEAAVAVVGTRKCTPYGTGTASQLGYELARQGGLELWADSTSKGKGWIKTMQTLEKRLQSPMPAYKKVTKPVVPEQDPWELNDIYAYQFHSESSKWNGTYGKYALLQKIGVQKNTYFNKLGMVVQIFDKYFRDAHKAQREITASLDDFEKSMSYEYIEGFPKFVSDIRHASIKTAVVTSSNIKKMENVYRAHPEFHDLFDDILTSEDFERSKPDPDCYFKGAEHFGVQPNMCIGFEDSINGLKAVNAAGMYCVGLETTNPHDVVAEYADMVIDNYLDTDDKEGNGKYNKLMGLFV